MAQTANDKWFPTKSDQTLHNAVNELIKWAKSIDKTSTIVVSEEPPENVLEGSLWLKPSTGELYSLKDDEWTLEGVFKGPKGDKGEKGEPATVPTFEIDDNGHLLVTQEEQSAVTFSLSEKGHLIASYN